MWCVKRISNQAIENYTMKSNNINLNIAEYRTVTNGREVIALLALQRIKITHTNLLNKNCRFHGIRLGMTCSFNNVVNTNNIS